MEVVDVDGAALTPGFIDAHMHLESTKLWIDAFVATVLPLGTTAVAADPHELANVLGVAGVKALAQAVAPLPITFAIYASSCVPASQFERSGADLDAADIAEMIERCGALGVAEVMNFPGVIAGDQEMLARIAAAGRLRVDGHSPGVSGPALDAYLAAGVESDHEATTLEEADEKRRKGDVGVPAPGLGEPGSGGARAERRRARDRPRRALHRRSRTRHARAPGPRQRLRPARGRQRDLGNRRDRAGVDQPRALPRLGSARQPRPGPSGRRARVRRAAVLGAGTRLASRPFRCRRRVDRARSGSRCAGSGAAARHGHDRGAAAGRTARARPAAGHAGPGRRRHQPQPHDPRRARDARLRRRRPRRRRRAPPRDRPDRPRVRDRLRPAARRDRLDRRPRRAQRRLRRRLRGRHGGRGRPAGRARRRPTGGARRRPSSPSCRCRWPG